MRLWKKGVAIVLAILAISIVVAAYQLSSSTGLAFTDFDVNEDHQVTDADVIEVVNHIGDSINPPYVSKYDLDLDVDVDWNDVYTILYNKSSSQYTIEVDYVSLQVDYNGIPVYFSIAYPKNENELQKFVDWYNHYTSVKYHTWSRDGREDIEGPNTTPYYYVCADFAVDAYWVANKNFFNGDNVIHHPNPTIIKLQ